MALRDVQWLIVVWCAGVSACGGTGTPPAPDDAPEGLSVTRWTDKSELFAEYPPLVVGHTSRFAIHLTRLEPFKAITEGSVEVHLTTTDGPAEVFRAEKLSRPGIFGVDVRPARAGRRDLLIVLKGTDVSDEHAVGAVEVYSDAATALRSAAAAGPEPEGISFLKEQQWALEFGTAVVAERPIRESIRVPAEITPRAGGAADVAAPVMGRLTSIADVTIGAAVRQGQELAHILPPPAAAGELPQLERARAEATAQQELAVRDRERAERLVNAGAAPQRRLDDARTADTQAAARLRAASAELEQYNAARTVATATATSLFVVRAPITGVIATRDATAGANVAVGAVLFQIVDATAVEVVGQVPEAQAPRVRLVTSAAVETAGNDILLPAGRLISVGKVLDPRGRTLPVIFAFDNTKPGLPVGQNVVLHLLLQQTASSPVIPLSAVVDDAGRPIAFVQMAGELFERRPVTLGHRERDLVQVLSGVKPGERVVTRGAYLVRLASLSTSVPAHGHVH